MSTADTPTLSPAAQERLDAAVEAFGNATINRVHVALATGRRSGTWYEAHTAKDTARAALTATVAALVAEAEARGREAGGIAPDDVREAVAQLRGYVVTEGEPGELPRVIRSPDRAACERVAHALVTPTPHAPWCQSRHYHAPAAPLPCNCAGHRDQGEGEEVL